MPIYEYEREDGSTFEIIQKVNDAALGKCPTTGQSVTKKISASMPIFKGNGFYKTDYCGNKNNATGTEAKGTDSGSASSTTSDSKPADSTAKPKGCGTGCGCH